MRTNILFAVVALGLTVLLAASPLGTPRATAQGAPGPYLYDLMQKPAYRGAWSNMVHGETVPQWVRKFGATLNAVGTPVKTVPVGGQPYTLAWICEPHNCGGNEVYVLFAPGARQAWAYLISEGTKKKWLGKPDEAVKAAILSNVQ